MNDCGIRKRKYADKNTLLSMTTKDMVSFLRSKGHKGISTLHRSQLCDLMRHYIKQSLSPVSSPSISHTTNHSYLRYDGQNSCYLDSVLVALFHTKHKWIQRTILRKKKVHTNSKELSHIYNDIRKGLVNIYNEKAKTCTNIRSLFQLFDIEYATVHNIRLEDIDWKRQQQEPRDVFDILMRIFEIKPSITLKVNDNTRKVFFSSPYIPAYDMRGKTSISLDTYFPVHEDGAKHTYMRAQFVCFNIERNYLHRKLTTRVQISETISPIRNTEPLHLTSIILHNGEQTHNGHYTCIIKKKKGWYLYDDMDASLTFVSSSFQGMMKWKNNYIPSNCTTLVYHTIS